VTSYRITIRTLGVFAVFRGGDAVPACAWQSKKARDVLKILVMRRGRPTMRDVVIEALWPEQDPRRTSNRLSVALSTVRSVLDPERRFPADWFIRADRYTARLDLEHVDVDIERFFALAGAGLARHRNRFEAASLLARAEAAYTGDFLEEDLYEDWAAPLRAEAQAMRQAVADALVQTVGRHEAARSAHRRIRCRPTLRPYPVPARARPAIPTGAQDARDDDPGAGREECHEVRERDEESNSEEQRHPAQPAPARGA